MTEHDLPERFLAVHNHGHVHLEDSMGTDLHIVNNARVSFDQESDEFTAKERGLLNFLMRERHGSPWESVVFRFDVKAPIFVVREWQRHRVGCLSADTEVTFVDTNGSASKQLRKTIGELHRMWTEGETNGRATSVETVARIQSLLPEQLSDREIGRRTGVSHMTVAKIRRGEACRTRDSKWRVRGMRLRVLNEDTNEFTVGHICDVIDSGRKQVFRVVTESGRSIEMTAEHRVYTDAGWRRLGELARIDGTSVDLPEDAFIMANGVVAQLPAIAQRQHAAGRRLVAHADRVISVTYLGVKQTYDLSVDGPWHNFVANGLVVHNSFNEQSARYSQVPDHYYVPERDHLRQQVGKPGNYSFEPIDDDAVAGEALELLETQQRDAFAAYHRMLELGLAKELARTVLPVGMFSRMKWTVNLRALFNFLSLRNDEHAQREIRDYAVAVEHLAKDVVPVAFEVFEQNGRVCP